MIICLVRHGETDWNSLGRFQGREDIPLNQTGIGQVRKTALYLKNFRWDKIITSPLSRAKMSAGIIGMEIGLNEIHEEADFVERDLGEMSGMTRRELDINIPDRKYNGLEPLEALCERTVNALHKWVEKFEGMNILIVTHGAAINSILTEISGNKIEMGKAIPKNAGVIMLEKKRDKLQILDFCKDEFLSFEKI